ncbi:MAG: hypothetical protein HZB55_14290 [Deltaproteobacteria bacterium]|nr:hypothetical protein [Deltaproteobacteria bacterium]
MAPKVLSALFWCFALFLLGYSAVEAGWLLAVPAAVAAVGVAFLLDLWMHRGLVTLDARLLRTALHLLSAAAVAAACMVWLVRVLLSRVP